MKGDRDVVAVGIQHMGTTIRGVLRARAQRTVVLGTCGQSNCIERDYCCASDRAESPVARPRRFALADPEIRAVVMSGASARLAPAIRLAGVSSPGAGASPRVNLLGGVQNMRALLSSYFSGLAAVILMATSPARADDCATIRAASIAQIKVPHTDAHLTIPPGMAPQQIDMVFKNDKVYTRYNGAWSSMAFPAQDQIDTINKVASTTRPGADYSCQKVGNESINGESAAVFASHDASHGKVTDSRIWLSDKTGLPLKSEIHLSNGTVVRDEFRYTNVDAPPGVK